MPDRNDVIWELLSKKLSGEATPAELEELEALLRQEPDVHYAAGHLEDLWAQEATVPDHQREQAFADHLDRMRQAGVNWDEPEKKVRRMSMRWVAAAAAAVLLLAALAGWWWMPRESASPAVAEELRAAKGTRTRVTLPDGSVVWLNADSRLVYNDDFNQTRREVQLEGEAFFDVMKNSSKPFIIRTANMKVRVLGTTFNIRAYPGESTAETALIKGSVEVSREGAAPVILKPHEKLVLFLDEQEQSTTTKEQRDFVVRKLQVTEYDEEPLETAWVDNKLVFRDEAFSTLATRLERWYGVQITLGDAAVRDLRFTGRFEKETIEQVLKALQITAEFKYSVNGRNIIISQH